MDIKQALDASAVCTLGKDMTFRDYAQGTYRMRGIGKGQTIELYITPEIQYLVDSEVARGKGDEVLPYDQRLTQKQREMARPPVRQQLLDVSAWLVVNSMKSEKTQVIREHGPPSCPCPLTPWSSPRAMPSPSLAMSPPQGFSLFLFLSISSLSCVSFGCAVPATVRTEREQHLAQGRLPPHDAPPRRRGRPAQRRAWLAHRGGHQRLP